MLRELTAVTGDWLRTVPRGWRIALGGALLLVAVLAAARVVRGGDRPARPPGAAADRRAGTTAPQGAVMLRQDGAAVIGVLHTNDGAAAAALSYSVQRDRLLTGATSSAVAAEVGSRLAVAGHDIGDRPASIPDRAADRNAEAMLAARQGTTGSLTIPIAHRVRAYRGTRAVVRVFSALLNVGVDPARGPGAVGFATRDMTLSWSAGAWRIRSVVDTPDQPTPTIVVATNSRRDAATLPTRDRVLHADTSDSAGLFAWLRDASTIQVGPSGMGPTAGSTSPTTDRNLADALAGGFRRRARARSANLDSPGWSASTPVAAATTACPTSVGDGLRCFEVLVAGTTLAERGIAIFNLQLAGLAVLAQPGRPGSVAFDVNDEVQRRVLGGTIRIASTGLPESRTTGAAWRRTTASLSAAIPASGR
jgi:hypothetical protein